jgi:hypothetical protein
MKPLEHIQRVAFFFSMALAHIDLTLDEEPVDENAIFFEFQGSGASDILTVGQVRAFVDAVKVLDKKKAPA